MNADECPLEPRVRALEQKEAIMGVKMEHIIGRLDKLVDTLTRFIWIVVTATVTVVGSLFILWIKGGI
jgi:hypothetical protein